MIDIYSGNITNWKTVEAAARPYGRFRGLMDSGSQNLMEKLVMKGTAMAEAPQDFVVSEMGELIEKVSAYDNTGRPSVIRSIIMQKTCIKNRNLNLWRSTALCPPATPYGTEAILMSAIFMQRSGRMNQRDSNAYRLFEWLTSDDGQALINALGYVGVRDEKKLLPQGFEGEDEVFQAKIPLSKGEVILADGGYLYGENGIAVFDRSMNLMKFIRHVESQAISPFLVWDGAACFPCRTL